MSNIKEVKFGPAEINENAIEILKEWLELAEKGEIVSVALAGVKPSGTTATEWTGCADGWFHHLNSAISVLHYRIIRDNT